MSDTGDIRTVVREKYGEIAEGKRSGCGCSAAPAAGASCCGDVMLTLGYTEEQKQTIPEGADLGLGCGNPLAHAAVKPGETVLDLGSGAGFDCFIAAKQVGAKGRVIGVDMTPEMLDKARENARKVGAGNVEFRLGEIENLPVANGSVDAVISNCVINLAQDKARVFAEAFRALKPGGRLMVSDLVLNAPLPKAVQESVAAYVGCLAGASLKVDYLRAIELAGFKDVQVKSEDPFPVELMQNDPTAQAIVKDLDVTREEVARIAGTIVSVKVSARKPA